MQTDALVFCSNPYAPNEKAAENRQLACLYFGNKIDVMRKHPAHSLVRRLLRLDAEQIIEGNIAAPP